MSVSGPASSSSLWHLQELLRLKTDESQTKLQWLKTHRTQSNPADLCSFLSRSSTISLLEEGGTAQDLVYNFFHAFFNSLRLPHVAACVAVQCNTLKAFINAYNPDTAMGDIADRGLLRAFWAEAAPALADATFETLQGMQTYSQQQEQTTNAGKFDELMLGGLEAFFVGLNAVIGLPKMNVLDAMEEEHKSTEQFESHNQGRTIQSSPLQEWKRLLPDGSHGRINNRDYDDTEDVCDDFMAHEMVAKAGLEREEVIALRLYTSPMYVMYNKRLRTLLEIYHKIRDQYPNNEAAALQEARERAAGERGQGDFVTTIHAIASGLQKISQVSTHKGMVYRGTSGRKIPECFLDSNKSGGRGGVEYGFLSASTSKHEAMIYATSQKEMSMLFEIETGMVDRGADLAWVSYFPKERELLLPPLSSLEVSGIPRFERVELEGGAGGAGEERWVMVWPLKINVNMKAATLQELRERRKTLHMGMFDNLLFEIDRDLESVGALHDDEARRRLVEQCTSVFNSHQEREAVWYNSDSNYKDALTEALNTKKLALRKLQVLLPRVELVVGDDGTCETRREPLPSAERRAILQQPLCEIGRDYLYFSLLSAKASFPWEAVWTHAEAARSVVVGQELSPRQVHLALKSISSNLVAVNRVAFGSLVLEKQAASAQGRAGAEWCPDGATPTLALREMPTPLSQDGGRLVACMLLGRAAMQQQDSIGGSVLSAGSLDLASPVTALDLSGSRLFSAGSVELARGLRGGAGRLRELRLEKCALGLEGGARIFEALGELQEQRLELVSVHYNVLSQSAQAALGRWLGRCSTLTALDVSHCCLSEAPLPALCAGLRARTSLQRLDVGGNLLRREACAMLAGAVRSLGSLTSFNQLAIAQGAAAWEDAGLARVGAGDCALMESLLEQNPQLTRLVSLAPPEEGEWGVHAQLDGGEARRREVGWWASVEVAAAFVLARLRSNRKISHVRLHRCPQLQGTEGGAGKGPAEEVVAAEREEEIAELMRGAGRWMGGEELLRRIKTRSPTTVQQNQMVENDLEGTLAMLAAGTLIPVNYHSHRQAVQAAFRGKWETCMSLIARTPEEELDKSDHEGRTALMMAARDGNGSLVVELLRKKAQVNRQDREGQTALHLAAGRGRDAVVEMLIERGAHLTIAGYDGWTALHCAARYGPDNAAMTLLKSISALGPAGEAAVNAATESRCTALMFAAAQGKVRTVELLLQQRADVDVVARQSMTATMEAAKGGHAAVVAKLLEAKADLSLQSADGRTAVTHAIGHGHEKIAEQLIERSEGETLDALDEDGHTAMMLAVLHGQLGLVERLTRRNAQVDRASKEGKTALMEAANVNRRPAVEALIAAKADLNLQDGDGRTALMMAAKGGYGPLVDTLLGKGAQVNCASKNGWTALMMAAERGHLSVVEALHRRNADVGMRSIDKRTALQLAKKKGHHSVVALLGSAERKGLAASERHTLKETPTPESPGGKDADVEEEGAEKEESMYITPREVDPRYISGHLVPRDKYDLMHSTGHALHFRIDTSVFDLIPVAEGEESLVKVETLVHKSKFLRGKWLQLLSSPLSALTLANERRTAAAIPKDACYFSFCHPAEFKQDGREKEWAALCEKESFVNFLVSGGYVYFNAMYDIVQVNSLHVRPAPVNSLDTGFRFDTSWEMQPASIEYLDRWNRWNPITVEFLKKQGHDVFAWVNPSEVLGDQFISPYGGFAYRYRDNHGKAVYRPITLDADMDVIPAPEHSFTTKVGGTSEGTEDTSSEHEHAAKHGRGARWPGASPPPLSPSAARGKAPQGEGVHQPMIEARWKRKGLLVGVTGGVTGLMEVRAEVGEQLRHHLLVVADKAREEAREEAERQRAKEEKALALLEEVEGGAGGEPAQEREGGVRRGPSSDAAFDETDPTTWKDEHLPTISAMDSREVKEGKIRYLARLHKYCAKRWRLSIPVPMNLIKMTHFGEGRDTVKVGDCFFPQDLYMLMRSRRNQVQFVFDCKAFSSVHERTRAWLRGHFPSVLDQQFLELSSSPLNNITLPEDVQVRAGIPRQAVFFCFCYPLDKEKYPRAAHPVADKVRRPSLEGDHAPGAKRRKHYRADPLVCFFKQGGFVYFDAKYEVVAINALSSAERTRTRNLIYLGPCVDLPRTAIDPLNAAGRWRPVGHKAAVQSGFTHKAWINPSEVLADHIFCGHGGFAFLNEADGRAEYFAVVKSTFDADEETQSYKPEPYDMCLFGLQKSIPASLAKFGISSIHELPLSLEALPNLIGARRLPSAPPEREEGGSSPGEVLRWLSGREGLDEEEVLRQDEALLRAIRDEFARCWQREEEEEVPDRERVVQGEDWQAVQYVLFQSAEYAEEEVDSDAHCEVRQFDKGHEKWTLQDFAKSAEARAARLLVCEVAALRILTTCCHRGINLPFWQGTDAAHPLPTTVACIKSGMGKLRQVLCVAHEVSRFKTKYLWCGVHKLCGVNELSGAAGDAAPLSRDSSVGSFVMAREASTLAQVHHSVQHEWYHRLLQTLLPAEGRDAEGAGDAGREFSTAGFLSASENIGVVADHCPDSFPVVLRIKVSSALEMGASLSWLSVYPAEHEVVFPPGAALCAMYKQGVKHLPRGAEAAVVTVGISCPDADPTLLDPLETGPRDLGRPRASGSPAAGASETCSRATSSSSVGAEVVVPAYRRRSSASMMMMMMMGRRRSSSTMMSLRRRSSEHLSGMSSASAVGSSSEAEQSPRRAGMVPAADSSDEMTAIPETPSSPPPRARAHDDADDEDEWQDSREAGAETE